MNAWAQRRSSSATIGGEVRRVDTTLRVGETDGLHSFLHRKPQSPGLHQGARSVPANSPSANLSEASSCPRGQLHDLPQLRGSGSLVGRILPAQFPGPRRTECVESLLGCRGGDADLGQAFSYGPGLRRSCLKFICHHRTVAIVPPNRRTETSSTVATTNQTPVPSFAFIDFTPNVQGHAGDDPTPRLAPLYPSPHRGGPGQCLLLRANGRSRRSAVGVLDTAADELGDFDQRANLCRP